EEGARLLATDLQPILKSGHSRRWQIHLPRLPALASSDPELSADQVQVGDVHGNRLGTVEPATVGEGQEGGVAATSDGRVVSRPVARGAGAGVEQTAQFCSGEV